MRTATSPVTNGESQPQEEEPVRDGDVISALKLQTEEIALVNACLKEVGEVEEGVDEMVMSSYNPGHEPRPPRAKLDP